MFVSEASGGECFAAEALCDLFVCGVLWVEDFDREARPQITMLCVVYDPKASFAFALDQSIVADDSADQWIRGIAIVQRGTIFLAKTSLWWVFMSTCRTNDEFFYHFQLL